MDDTISRHAAIDALCDNCDHVEAVCPHYPCKQYIAIENLPPEQPEVLAHGEGELSAQPEQKRGKWIIDDGFIDCSVCRHEKWSRVPYEDLVKGFRFCPNCGADMRGDQNEAD